VQAWIFVVTGMTNAGTDRMFLALFTATTTRPKKKALIETMRSREDLSAELVDKILIQNPKEFYSL